MPIIHKSGYKPPLFFENGHVQTLFPRLFRPPKPVNYHRTRIETPDGDFLDLDYARAGGKKGVILLHGLEGDTYRHYMTGMAWALNRRGLDVIAMNLRGCGGQPNRKLRFYHQGATEDLHTVIEHVLENDQYRALALCGFSLGGNLVLKYLGDGIYGVPDRIENAAAISVACDLKSCALKLARPENRIYMKYFLGSLHKKIQAKMRLFPDRLHDRNYKDIRTFMEYDNRYTAPFHGFTDARNYYEKTACKPFLSHISRPALLINAMNDPFLTEQCYPRKIAAASRALILETPSSGGHVGFISFNRQKEYWHETRVAEFLRS